MQHKSDKACAFRGVKGSASEVEFTIVDIPKDLPVLMVSSLSTSNPKWNFDDKNFFTMLFELGSSLAYDNGMLLLFHKDVLKLKADIIGLPLLSLEGMDKNKPLANH